MKHWLYQTGNFILTVTRIVPEKDAKKKLVVKRKTSKICSNIAIYMFDTFDEYLEFCTLITNNIGNTTYTLFKNSSLYLYKSKYYLCLYINQNNIIDFKSIHYSIVEFASCINNSELFERKLREYGKLIFKTDAISNCVKHFN